MNKYIENLFVNMSNDGMNDELWEVAVNDLNNFKNADVKSDKDRNLYLYLENVITRIFKNIDDGQVRDLINKVFNELRDNVEITNDDIKNAIVKNFKKTAYPNSSGNFYSPSIPKYNVDKWIDALNNIYSGLYNGENKNDLINKITEDWSQMEKINFESWMKYYENGDHDKYDIKKSASGTLIPSFNRELFNQNTKQNEVSPELVRGPGRPRQTIRTLEQEKIALINRLDSAMKILRKFVDVWPKDIWQRLFSELSHLQGEIPTLKTSSTIADCVIKVANRLNRNGINGSEILIKIADTGDIANKIENALSGRNPDESREQQNTETPVNNQQDFMMPPMGQPELSQEQLPGMPEMPPELAQTEQMPDLEKEQPQMPPAGIEESLPKPEEPPTIENNEVEKPKKEKSDVNNPFDGKNITIQSVLEILEPISKTLNEREFPRSLSKVDMMLDSLHIASHFPELSEALSKSLELNIYVGTRIDKIINKLKGGLKVDSPNNDNIPEIDMSEFTSNKPNEKELFEVKEGE